MNIGQMVSRRATKGDLWDLASAASGLIGTPGPVIVSGLKFAWNQRHKLFSKSGEPIGAYTAARWPRRLTSLAVPSGAAQTPLLINILLTDTAYQVGLRNGDPVSVVLSGHQYLQNRSGLVIPTLIGEVVTVWVPNGNYSLVAFGSRRDALFTTRDPYSTVTGSNVLLTGQHQLDLSLSERYAIAPSAPVYPAPIGYGSPQSTPPYPAPAIVGCGCAQCTTPLTWHRLSLATAVLRAPPPTRATRHRSTRHRLSLVAAVLNAPPPTRHRSTSIPDRCSAFQLGPLLPDGAPDHRVEQLVPASAGCAG